MKLWKEIMNIKPLGGTYSDEFCYKLGHADAQQAAAELSLKAEARIDELEKALRELYIASGPVANCAYNVGQRHEDWENIKHYIDQLDKARTVAINVIQEKN